ncbi:retrovirus-related Pol polyprotein from transposon 17.6 [Trichonephila clavipes]|nr:retrovirus-related Pol polyprotein from transposon 17.6 [Trichonephila clavipes]
MPKREGPYLILTLRSPVTYEIADPANPDQALGTFHVSALKDYQEPETKRNTGFVAPLRKRGRSKKKLSPGSEPRRQWNQRGVSKHKLLLPRPAYSPEISPIEKEWNLVGRRLARDPHPTASKDEL